MHPTGMMRAGPRIGAVGYWSRDDAPVEDRAARFKTANFGFNGNPAKIGRRASRAAGISARKDDHASRVAGRLHGIRHEPHPSCNRQNVLRSPEFLAAGKKNQGATTRARQACGREGATEYAFGMR
jgi:hypothetical protein